MLRPARTRGGILCRPGGSAHGDRRPRDAPADGRGAIRFRAGDPRPGHGRADLRQRFRADHERPCGRRRFRFGNLRRRPRGRCRSRRSQGRYDDVRGQSRRRTDGSGGRNHHRAGRTCGRSHHRTDGSGRRNCRRWGRFGRNNEPPPRKFNGFARSGQR